MQAVIKTQHIPPAGVYSDNRVDSTTQKVKSASTSIWKDLGATVSKGIQRLVHGVRHREKTGPIVTSCQNGVHPESFYRDLFSQGVINQAVINQAIRLLPDFEKTNQYTAFITKATKPELSRLELDEQDWQVLDEVNYQLTQERLSSLSAMLKGKNFDTLHHEMDTTLGVDYEEALIAEVLARSLAYTLGLNGKKITIPTKLDDGTFKDIEYTIREYQLGDHLPCYILESRDPSARPWIVARGTETAIGRNIYGKEYRQGSLESLYADMLDREGVASAAVIKAIVNESKNQESLAQIFTKWQNEGKKVNLAGHSLGGYLIHDIAARFYTDVHAAYGFNAPSVGRDVANIYNHAEEKEAKELGISREQLRKKIVNFVCDGDVVSASGKVLIGNHIALTTAHGEYNSDPTHQHSRYALLGNFKAQNIDTKKESGKWARYLVDKTRYIAGKVLRSVLSCCSSDTLPDWWVHKDHYAHLYKEFTKGLQFAV